MPTFRKKEKPPVDPKLRRKMLERWENEGGKVGEIDPGPTQPGTDQGAHARGARLKDRPAKGT